MSLPKHDFTMTPQIKNGLFALESSGTMSDHVTAICRLINVLHSRLPEATAAEFRVRLWLGLLPDSKIWSGKMEDAALTDELIAIDPDGVKKQMEEQA